MDQQDQVRIYSSCDTDAEVALIAQCQAQQAQLEYLRKKMQEDSNIVQMRVLALQVAAQCGREWQDTESVLDTARAFLAFMQEG